MSILAALLDLMPHTVQLAAESGKNAAAEPTYGADADYQALVQQQARMVRDTQGRMVVSNTQVYLATTDAITPRYRITLPAGFTPQRPPIINVARFSDEDGLHHVEVYC